MTKPHPIKRVRRFIRESAFWTKRRLYRGYRRIRNGLVELRKRGDESSKGWMPMPEFEKRLKACDTEDKWLRLMNRPDVPLHLHGIIWKDDEPYRLMEDTLIDMSKAKHPHPDDLRIRHIAPAVPKPKKKQLKP